MDTDTRPDFTIRNDEMPPGVGALDEIPAVHATGGIMGGSGRSGGFDGYTPEDAKDDFFEYQRLESDRQRRAAADAADVMARQEEDAHQAAANSAPDAQEEPTTPSEPLFKDEEPSSMMAPMTPPRKTKKDKDTTQPTSAPTPNRQLSSAREIVKFKRNPIRLSTTLQNTQTERASVNEAFGKKIVQASTKTNNRASIVTTTTNGSSNAGKDPIQVLTYYLSCVNYLAPCLSARLLDSTCNYPRQTQNEILYLVGTAFSPHHLCHNLAPPPGMMIGHNNNYRLSYVMVLDDHERILPATVSNAFLAPEQVYTVTRRDYICASQDTYVQWGHVGHKLQRVLVCTSDWLQRNYYAPLQALKERLYVVLGTTRAKKLLASASNIQQEIPGGLLPQAAAVGLQLHASTFLPGHEVVCNSVNYTNEPGIVVELLDHQRMRIELTGRQSKIVIFPNAACQRKNVTQQKIIPVLDSDSSLQPIPPPSSPGRFHRHESKRDDDFGDDGDEDIEVPPAASAIPASAFAQTTSTQQQSFYNPPPPMAPPAVGGGGAAAASSVTPMMPPPFFMAVPVAPDDLSHKTAATWQPPPATAPTAGSSSGGAAQPSAPFESFLNPMSTIRTPDAPAEPTAPFESMMMTSSQQSGSGTATRAAPPATTDSSSGGGGGGGAGFLVGALAAAVGAAARLAKGDDNNKGSTTNSEVLKSDMVKTVTAALQDWDLTFTVVPLEQLRQPNIPLIKFEMSGTYSTYSAILSMDLEDDVFSVYYTCPVRVIESRRAVAARFLADANYKIMIGHFDLDFSDGEVRFKSSIIVQGTKLSKQMAQQMVGIAIKTMDKFMPGLLALDFGEFSPEEAMREVEQPPQPIGLEEE